MTLTKRWADSIMRTAIGYSPDGHTWFPYGPWAVPGAVAYIRFGFVEDLRGWRRVAWRMATWMGAAW